MRKANRFVLRPFVSYFVTFSFIHLIVSSVILYIAPPGRFTNRVDWKILGITKAGWQAQHTVVGYLFIIAAVVHLVLNWRIFLSYIRSKAKKSLNRGWELFAAFALIIMVTAGVEYQWPPFKAVMNLGESLSESWEETVLSDSGSSSGEEHESSNGGGRGFGRMTLETVIAESGIPPKTAFERLNNQGIDADANDILRDIMNRYGVTLSELTSIITAEE